MPVTLGQIQFDRRNFHEVMWNREHVVRGDSRYLDRAYFPADDYGERLIAPGLVLAVNTTTKKFVPWNSSAAYGPGSDTAVGMTDVLLDGTLEDPPTEAVIHGGFIESRCYVYGSAVGTIAAGAKSDMPGIMWR